MMRAEVEARLAAVIDAESKVGIPWWPGSKMAPISFRRWTSFARRHKTKNPTDEQRVLDLAKGLQAYFEPGFRYTPLSEFLHLARLVARELATLDAKQAES